MIRLAMVSFWHVHAPDYEQQARTNAASSVVAVWDEVPQRGRAAAATLGVPFYERLDELLANDAIDAIIVDTPTTMHREVIVAAARAGKHVFTEKVLAPTLHECNQIVAAVEQAGVKLMVSLPRLYTGSTLTIKGILDRKLLGEVTEVRVRLYHDGALRTRQHPQGWLPAAFFDPAQSAGGALIDLGAHPMYLTRLLLGLPESVTATYGSFTGRAVEDSAVVTLHYPGGATGVVEAGFVNPFAPFSIEAHGTQGSLLYGTPESTLSVRSSQVAGSSANRWTAWTEMQPDQPPPLQQWVSHIERGTTASENIQAAIDLSMLMEAAYLSARHHQPIQLSSLAH